MTSEEAGARGRGGALGSAEHPDGSQAAPQPRPPAWTLEAGGPVWRGRGESTPRVLSAPGGPASFSLPALSRRDCSPSTSRPHRPARQPTCKAEQRRNSLPAGLEVVRDPRVSFFPPTSSFLPLALCLSLQVSLYCTDTLFAKPHHAPERDTTWPGTTPRGLGGKGGGKRGRAGGRLAAAAALPVQRGGGGGRGSPAEALCKLNKSSDLPCRSGLSCSVV